MQTSVRTRSLEFDILALGIGWAYHLSRTKHKADWEKFEFPTQNETAFGENVSVCMANVQSYICMFIFRYNLLQQCFIRKNTRASRIPSCSRDGKHFSLAQFLIQLNAERALQNYSSSDS